MRQMTYTFMRFGAYEGLKTQVKGDSFMHKVALAGLAGAAGGLVGSPADLVNVRMQNDVKLPYAQRRHYKNAVDGVYQIIKNEGAGTLFNGGTMAVARAILMTIGQLAFYDQVKATLVKNQIMDDSVPTHLLSSFVAASAATVLTQPVDVLKTRMMNAKNGEYKGVMDCFLQTARGGPTAFYSGLVPSFVRMAPHTILLFVFVEQLRMNFGYLRPQKLTQ
ncbi:hypothetical protein M3Y97_00036200 [Aphelenchoides bicaudatus]|nr:hypothetical protein M3Y97_00036200 [Aphelenchoides bicaudatus]